MSDEPTAKRIFNFAPRCLSRVEAAYYVGVSVDVFDYEVRTGMWPAPHRRGGKGGKPTWDIMLLDRFIDHQSGLISPQAGEGDPVLAHERKLWEDRLSGKTKNQGPQHQLDPGEKLWADRLSGKTKNRRL